MKRLDIFANLFLVLFAIYVAVTCYAFGLGSLRKPGPGFFPFGGAVIMGICAIVVLFGDLSRNRTEQPIAVENTRWWNVGFVIGAIVVFALLAKSLGFFLCTFLMFILFQRMVSSQSWTKSIIVASCTTIGTYIVFDVLLNAWLPKGVFGF